MRSQPHPLNREEGTLPHVYDELIHLNTLPPRVHRTSSNTELISSRVPPVGHSSCQFSHFYHLCTYKVSVDVFYCSVTTEEDHRSVVEAFGEKDKFFVEPPG